MFREFNVKFEDVEMIGGTDNLLENTEITKVIVRGDSKMSSLDSTFKNCKELDTIDGELDLNGVSDIDNLLENTELVKSISLKNINNENISANNSFPHIEEMNIGGELYNKKAMQNVIASREWTFDNITYSGTVADNLQSKTIDVVDDNKATIKDALEQKVRGIEIIGQTYENLAKNKGEYELTGDFSKTWTESDYSIDNPPSMIEIPEIWGNTVQGYPRAITNKDIVDHMNGFGISNIKFQYIDEKTIECLVDGGYGGDHFAKLIASDNSKALKLKPDTTYSFRCSVPFSRYANISSDTGVLLDITNKNNGTFITTSSGLVAMYLRYKGNFDFILVEGSEIPSLPTHDLNYIQSVGDLYVDEEDNPILDEEGNEQYKLEIESYSDGNVFLNDNMIKFESNSNWDILKDGVNSFTLSQKIRQNYITSTTYILPAGEYTFTYDYTKIQGSGSGCDSFLVYIGDISEPATSTKTWKFAINKPTPFYFSLRNYAEASATNVSITKYTFNLVRGEYNNYFNINSQSNKTTILMPCKLMKVSDGRDRLFWDISKNKYIIEKNVRKMIINEDTRFITERNQNGYTLYNIDTYQSSKPNGSKFINDTFPTGTDFGDTTSEWMMAMWSSKLYLSISNTRGRVNEWFRDNPTTVYYHSTISETVETKILEKPSLKTYSPKTYVSTNTEVQPSQMSITNKKVLINLKELNTDTNYTIQFECNEKSDNPIKFNLCGTEKEVDMPIGVNHVSITTSNNLANNQLELSGAGNTVSEVMVVEGNMNQYPSYFDGVVNTGEQDDGTCSIEISSNRQFVSVDSFVAGRLDRGILGYQSDSTLTIKGNDIECVTSTGWRGCVSGFAKINPSTEYSFDYELISSFGQVTPCPHFYTKDKVYISDLYNKSNFITPGNAEYVRIYFQHTDSGTFIIKDFDFSDKTTQSIISNLPLTSEDKLYWNKSNRRYEIDRNGDIEIPVVEGDVVDLPRLYQREDTDLVVETGNIKPSNIKFNYNDLY